MQPRERMMGIRGGIRLGARIWGNEDAAGPPGSKWLALHGFLDNAATYDKLAPELLSLGASSVVCLDLAGHGKSEWRKSGVYYVVDNVADVVYAADALQWDKFCIIGHSLGGDPHDSKYEIRARRSWRSPWGSSRRQTAYRCRTGLRGVVGRGPCSCGCLLAQI